jgi:hypothetical protein
MRCASTVSAHSSTSDIGSVGEDRTMKRTGCIEGLTLRRLGGVGMDGGSCERVAAMAVWTSCAAASISRSRENCSVMFVEPWLDVEFIESIPAMPENCRSSGVATAAAIVSGFAPGRLAPTLIVGKSTFGRSATGSER